MATIFYTNGTIEELHVEAGKTIPTKKLQEIVDGYIEIVKIPYYDKNKKYHNGWLVVNEEGKLMNLEYNQTATNFLTTMGYCSDYIVGNAVFCLEGEIN